jgi:Holliday junction DNA helicase RuvA
VIGFLRGRLAHKSPPLLVVDVNGVGYEIETPMSTCLNLPDPGNDIHIVTHLVVREDQHTLYGFADEAERQMFRDLLKVNRVGAKLALGILSGISIDNLIRCIQQEDSGTLSKLPGVGKKTAERLIMDMRDRVANQLTELTLVTVGKGTPADAPKREAFTALTGLGYKPAEAQRMLDKVGAEQLTTEDILRDVLKSVAPAGGAL